MSLKYEPSFHPPNYPPTFTPGRWVSPTHLPSRRYPYSGNALHRSLSSRLFGGPASRHLSTACLPAYLPTFLPTYLNTYLNTHLNTYLHTYLPTTHQPSQNHGRFLDPFKSSMWRARRGVRYTVVSPWFHYAFL